MHPVANTQEPGIDGCRSNPITKINLFQNRGVEPEARIYICIFPFNSHFVRLGSWYEARGPAAAGRQVRARRGRPPPSSPLPAGPRPERMPGREGESPAGRQQRMRAAIMARQPPAGGREGRRGRADAILRLSRFTPRRPLRALPGTGRLGPAGRAASFPPPAAPPRQPPAEPSPLPPPRLQHGSPLPALTLPAAEQRRAGQGRAGGTAAAPPGVPAPPASQRRTEPPLPARAAPAAGRSGAAAARPAPGAGGWRPPGPRRFPAVAPGGRRRASSCRPGPEGRRRGEAHGLGPFGGCPQASPSAQTRQN